MGQPVLWPIMSGFFFSLRCAAAAYLSCCHIKSIFFQTFAFTVSIYNMITIMLVHLFFCLLFDNLFSDDEIFLFRNKYEYLQIWWRWAAKIPNEMTRHFSSFSTLTSMFCQQTWFAYVPTSYYKKKAQNEL